MNVSGGPLTPPLQSMITLWRASDANPRSADEEDVQLFGYARQALAAGLRNLRKGTLLAPAYICDTAVDHLPSLGFPVRFYPVNDDLTPDWNWLDQNRTTTDSALLLVHYFGFPNDLQRAEEFCRYATMSLVEDCAHSFLSQFQGQPLGATGAFAIFSYRKTLPLRTGAGYYSARGDTVPDPGPNRSNTNIFAIREWLRWAVYRSNSEMLRRYFSGALSDEDKAEVIESAAIDRYSRVLMARLAPTIDGIRQRRRDNYAALLHEMLRTRGVTVVKRELAVGDCPWAFPILVDRRDQLLQALNDAGIGASTWPKLPGLLPLQEFAHEVDLSRRTLLLPIHQDLGPRHIEHIANTVTAWSIDNA